jgi:hypothetical protein
MHIKSIIHSSIAIISLRNVSLAGLEPGPSVSDTNAMPLRNATTIVSTDKNLYGYSKQKVLNSIKKIREAKFHTLT